jgi:hypothetical protein
MSHKQQELTTDNRYQGGSAFTAADTVLKNASTGNTTTEF